MRGLGAVPGLRGADVNRLCPWIRLDEAQLRERFAHDPLFAPPAPRLSLGWDLGYTSVPVVVTPLMPPDRFAPLAHSPENDALLRQLAAHSRLALADLETRLWEDALYSAECETTWTTAETQPPGSFTLESLTDTVRALRCPDELRIQYQDPVPMRRALRDWATSQPPPPEPEAIRLFSLVEFTHIVREPHWQWTAFPSHHGHPYDPLSRTPREIPPEEHPLLLADGTHNADCICRPCRFKFYEEAALWRATQGLPRFFRRVTFGLGSHRYPDEYDLELDTWPAPDGAPA